MSFLRTISASIMVASLAFAAAACSSGDSGGSVASDRDSFIRQLCEQYMPCCAKASKPTDGAVCRAFYGSVTANAAYDAAAGSKCLDEVRAQASSATFCMDGMSSNNSPTCRTVFGNGGGTAKPGETCSTDGDCAPSSEGTVDCASLSKDGATIKKCQIQIAGKAGDSPCVGTVEGNITYYAGSGTATDIPPKGYLCYVKDGVSCDGLTKACKAMGKVGEACTGGSYACTKDAYCDTATKLCAARKPVGAACESYSAQCADGTYCNTTTKVCTASLADGAACKTGSECASRICFNGVCKAATTNLSTALLCGK